MTGDLDRRQVGRAVDPAVLGQGCSPEQVSYEPEHRSERHRSHGDDAQPTVERGSWGE